MTENTNPGVHPVEKTAPPSFSIDARTLAMAALFLVGGAGSGFGTSMLGGNNVAEKVEALAVEVRELKLTITRSAGADEIYRSRIDDHERRLRDLERKVP